MVENTTRKLISQTISIIFFLECIIKIIAMGFYTGKKTYIKNGWNKLDFIVVATGQFINVFLLNLLDFGAYSVLDHHKLVL